jgi:hypothetical protein
VSLLGLIIFSGPRSYLSDVSLITATVISDASSWDEGTDNLSLVTRFVS